MWKGKSRRQQRIPDQLPSKGARELLCAFILSKVRTPITSEARPIPNPTPNAILSDRLNTVAGFPWATAKVADPSRDSVVEEEEMVTTPLDGLVTIEGVVSGIEAKPGRQVQRVK